MEFDSPGGTINLNYQSYALLYEEQEEDDKDTLAVDAR